MISVSPNYSIDSVTTHPNVPSGLTHLVGKLHDKLAKICRDVSRALWHAEKNLDAARALAERRKKALEPFAEIGADPGLTPRGPSIAGIHAVDFIEAKAAYDAKEEKP